MTRLLAAITEAAEEPGDSSIDFAQDREHDNG
jgi:hypothetical protein